MKNKLINLFIVILVRFFHATYRYKIVGSEKMDKAQRENKFKTFVLGSWHQTMFTNFTIHTTRRFTMIVSASKDGDVMANAMISFGHQPARGSSSKGGKEALLEVIRMMKTGLPAAMAMDGPRGPFHIAKPGAIEMARATESPIIPFGSAAKSFWCFHKSWDKFIIPKPFSKVVIYYGDPIFIPSELTREQFEECTKLVSEATIKADQMAASLL